MNYERTCLPPNNFLRPSRRSLKVSCFASTFLKTRFLSKDKLHSYSYILGITNIHEGHGKQINKRSCTSVSSSLFSTNYSAAQRILNFRMLCGNQVFYIMERMRKIIKGHAYKRKNCMFGVYQVYVLLVHCIKQDMLK